MRGPEQEPLRPEQPFWHLDEELGPLEVADLSSRFDLCTLRLKARTTTAHYHAHRELSPLSHDGTEHEVTTGRAYILVPTGAIDAIPDSTWYGLRPFDIATIRGLYFQEDRALGLWEVDTGGRLDTFTHAKLWILFESWLVRRFPAAGRLYTDPLAMSLLPAPIAFSRRRCQGDEVSVPLYQAARASPASPSRQSCTRARQSLVLKAAVPGACEYPA